MTNLKLARIPDRTPVKITISVPPELHQRLLDYGALYRETYGIEEPVVELVPAILKTFLDGDRAFARIAGARS